MNSNSYKDFIIEKLKATRRKGVTDLIKYLETTDFFEAPASTKYHGCYEHGLVEHCINVYDAMLTIDNSLFDTYGVPKEDPNSMIIVCLLHDLCKINTYHSKELWRKDNNGKWESYTGYVREPELPMGHAGKSLFIANSYIKLTEKEAQAIFWHMGPYDTSNYNSLNELSDCYTNNTLAFKLNQADMMATYILENEKLWNSVN